MKWYATHVYLGRSRDYAWCSRYVGFHNGLTAMTEEELIERLNDDRVTNVCGTCRKSLARRGPALVQSALAAYVARRKLRALERMQQAKPLSEAIREMSRG